MFRPLLAVLHAINDADCRPSVGKSLRVSTSGNHVILHAAEGTDASPLAVVPFALRTAYASGSIASHHRAKATPMKDVAAFRQATHRGIVAKTRVPRQLVHADVAVVVRHVSRHLFRRHWSGEALDEVARGGIRVLTSGVV